MRVKNATGIDLKSRWLVAGVGLGLLIGGCALLEPKAERYVPPPLGTAWVNARHDTGSYGSGSTQVPGSRGERMWQGHGVVTFETTGGTLVAEPDGSWLGIYNGDKPVMTWDPPLNWEWPLEVGKSWTREQRMTIHAANRTIPYVLTQKVESFEDVAVPAGTFKTFKVSTVTSLGDENLVWFSPDLGIFVKQSLRRTAKNPQGPGTREFELVSYKRGG
jgi:hypothetical protein